MRMSREVHGSLSPPSRSPLRCLLLGVLLPISPSMAGAPVTPESAYNDAGYVSVNGGAHNLFYWMFESRSSPPTSWPACLPARRPAGLACPPAREHGHNNMHIVYLAHRLGSRFVYIPTPYGAWLECKVWACRTEIIPGMPGGGVYRGRQCPPQGREGRELIGSARCSLVQAP